MFGFNGFGCSGMTLSSADGKHFWARNYDFPSAEGSTVTLVPRGFDIPLMQDPACEDRLTSRYACLGMGAVGQSAAPVLYDGVNERGLCGLYPSALGCHRADSATAGGGTGDAVVLVVYGHLHIRPRATGKSGRFDGGELSTHDSDKSPYARGWGVKMPDCLESLLQEAFTEVRD